MTPSRLRQLEAFRAVMQSGSVSRAAQRMLLTQPAVTKLLRSLEDETGLPLFDRSRRHLQPTPEAVKLEGAVGTLFGPQTGSIASSTTCVAWAAGNCGSRPCR